MKLEVIKNELEPHTRAINITYDNYPAMWEMIYPNIKEYYQNKTHDHFLNCSVADQLNEVCYSFKSSENT